MSGIRLTGGVVFIVLFFSSVVCLADDLELSVGVDEIGQCVKPFDRTITIKRQPTPLCLILANRSSSSQSVYWQVQAGGIASVSLELTDEQGKTVTVKRKEKPVSSDQVINNYLAAGASVTKTVMADPEEWNNIPVIEPGKAKKFKARAAFYNDGTTIYSEYYTLVLDGR